MPPRLILFGAFDRHNFGDLLLAHCAAAAHLGREVLFAGLAERDLRPWGGHAVRPLAELIGLYGGDPTELVHVGGEVLTTSAWEAAVMLQTPAEARRVIGRFERDAAGGRAWAAQFLGTRRALPYVVGAGDLPAGWTVRFVAVGGVAFEALAVDVRDEALHALRGAASVSVRDRRTRAALQEGGVSSVLVPDPAANVRGLFADVVAARRGGPAFAELRQSGAPWLAVQLAASWGDDASLARIARAVADAARKRRAEIVLFCAGLAPWHDDAGVLQRLASKLARVAPEIEVRVFPSADVFDLCALLAYADGYLGTSLHGWIVARSFGVPALCLVENGDAKAAVYVQTWADAVGGALTTLDGLPARCAALVEHGA